MMQLYTSPGACSQATHIALEEAGAAYEPIRVNFPAGQQRTPEYLALNPKGRVPALVTPQGVLTESPALLFYVAQTHPAANLAPSDPFALAKMQAFNAYLCATVHVAYAHGRRAERWADDTAAQASMKAKVVPNMRDCFALIENEYLAGPWVMGAQYTVADAYLFTFSGWFAGLGVALAEYPKVAAHFAAMNARPAVQRVLDWQKAQLG
jgi:glutathione S-transferase